jgi:hypothetical protein
MCGIVGALTFDAFEKKSEEKMRNEANIFITTQLLQMTVERGKDATGIALLWADGNYSGLKMGIPSPEFIARFGDTEKDFEGFLKLWREYPKQVKTFIGHCRKSSVGNSYDNKNNHPIQIGDLIMIHNGTLTNHEKIFDKLPSKRIGDVDSEAIGHLLNHYTNTGEEPFTTAALKEVTKRLHGTYSVLAMNGNNPFQVAQFRDGRPAEMVLVRPLKTVYIASEKKFLENVLFEYNKMAKLFVASAKFPYLKQADVEFKMLPDDSCAVWDLTVPVTDKTEIADLYDWEKTPLRVDKVWGSGTTTTTTSTYNNTYNNTQKKVSGTEVDASTKKSTKTSSDTADEDDANGLVWSKSLNKYKGQEGIDKTKKYGAVTVDITNGRILPAGEEDDNSEDDSETEGIKEVGTTEVENLISGAADVQELALVRTKTAAENLMTVMDAKKSETGGSGSKPDGSIAGSDNENDVPTTVQIDMTSDPDAIKAAEDFVEKGLEKYESDEEVASDLEVSGPSVLHPLPMYALANRIRKFIFKNGFIAGYITRKKEGGAPAPNDISMKLMRAEKKIRMMKIVIKLLGAALEYRTRGNSEDAVRLLFEKVIEETFEAGKTARLDMDLIFSVGDLQKMPMLQEIKERVMAKK